MVDRIGTGSALAREALQAALEQANRAAPGASPATSNAPRADSAAGAGSTAGADFDGVLEAGLDMMDRQVQTSESMPIDLLTGKVDDFHQIAVQLKSAELSFKFAMEIRNKLVDAYREIMRMNV
jgi:flagellar hook-basal body complex protein FliE